MKSEKHVSEDECHPEKNLDQTERNESSGFPDGGWGWMVVLGCGLMHFLIGGLHRSYAVVYVHLLDKFGSSAAITAWVGGLCSGIRFSLSPLAAGLCNRFGVRVIAFIGGLLSFFGLTLSAFAPSTEFMFFSYSLCIGLGGTLAYSQAIVLVNKYFNKRRSIATGIATAGSGIGAFVYSPVVSLLYSYYGFFGANLILAAVTFNLCVCGALYRPVKHNTSVRNMKVKNREAAKTASPVNGTIEGTIDKKVVNVKSQSGCEKCLKNKYIDLSLFCDPTFLIFGISQTMLTTSYMGSYIILLAHAENRGVVESKGVFLLSSIGIADMFGRLSSGFIFDCYALRRHRVMVYNLCIFLTALTYFGWAFSHTFALLLTFCICHGCINGLVVSQRSVIATDILGLERLSSSFGLTVMMQGFGNLIGPYIIGYLRDITGTYTPSFIFCGALTTTASICFFSGRIFGFMQRSNHH